MGPILVLYYSKHGSVKRLADAIAQGVLTTGQTVIVRTVPEVSLDNEPREINDGPPHVTLAELEQCSGLALGSPTYFGNMAAPMKHFIDSTTTQWLKGGLINKPACVFTSSSSMHGGQESTLLSMMLPLLHHGMVICGVPYSNPELHSTKSGGSPYGVSHYASHTQSSLSSEEKALCLAQGKRLAQMAHSLHTLDQDV